MNIIRKRIIEISESERIDVDSFIENNNGLIFHETLFNTIASESFKTSLFYLMAYNKNKLIGVCPLHTIKKNYLRLTFSNLTLFGIPYGGWVYDKDNATFDKLYESTKPKFFETLTIWPSFLHSDFTSRISKLHYSTSIIDLTLDESVILNSIISSNTRHNIKRASKKGILVSKTANIDLFIKLHNTLKKTFTQIYSYENDLFIKRLFLAYNQTNKAFIIKADFNEETISTVLCIGNLNAYHAFIAGRVSELPKNIYQNELIWWHCISSAKFFGSKCFDLCIIEPQRLSKIAQFKMGFSKELLFCPIVTKKAASFRVLNRIQRVFLKVS